MSKASKVENYHNTTLKPRLITITIEREAGFQLLRRVYENADYWIANIYFDEDAKDAITVGKWSVTDSVEEKYCLGEVTIDGKPWNPKSYLEKYGQTSKPNMRKKGKLLAKSPRKATPGRKMDEESDESESIC